MFRYDTVEVENGLKIGLYTDVIRSNIIDFYSLQSCHSSFKNFCAEIKAVFHTKHCFFLFNYFSVLFKSNMTEFVLRIQD